MDTIGTNFNNVLAAYQGTAYGSLNDVAYNNDNLGTNQSQISFPVKSGQTFQIQVGSGSATGTIILNISMASLASGGITNATVYGAPTTFNDNFSSRFAIAGSALTAVGFNDSATFESGEPRPDSTYDTLWWTWTAPQDGIVTIDTIGTNFNNVLAAYQGTAYSNLNYVEYANENLGTNQSQITFPVKSGQTFQIQVGGGDGTGTIILNLAMASLASGGILNDAVYGAPQPFNDNFSNRLTVSGTTLTALGFNISATTEGAEPSNGTNSIWWSWTAPYSGTATINTIGTDFNNYLYVFTGATLPSLTTVAAQTDNLGAGESQVQFTATAGQTYQIRISSNGQAGTAVLNINPQVESLDKSLYFQNGTALGVLGVGTTFTPTAWTGIGTMGSGWQERAVADINGDGVPDIIFQNGTLIGALILNASGQPASWVGIGSMNAGWELCGAGVIGIDGDLDLIFQNGTSIGYLDVNTSSVPVSWTGVGAMGSGWSLRAVADINGSGTPQLIFQNGPLIGALSVGTNGLPTGWQGIGSLSSGWTLAYAVDLTYNGQPELIFQNGTLVAALQINTSLQPISWNGIGGLGSGWTLPGDY